jgi:hypothetical protein
MQLRFLAYRVVTVLLAATGLLASTARAESGWGDDDDAVAPDAAVSFSASVQAFYAGMPDATGSLDPFGPGLGVRAGLTLPNALYLGVSYEHFFGAGPQGWVGAYSVDAEASLDEVQAWVGYELALDGVSLRPQLGLGYVYSREEIVADRAPVAERSTSSAHGVVVSPTLQLAFPVGPAWLLVDGRYAIIPEAVANGDALMIGVGFGVAL